MPRGPRRHERGAAAVEMAILLPVLILLIGGIVDYGRAFYTQIVLTNAAREGTRAAVVKLANADVTTRTQAAAQAVADSGYPVTVTITGTCAGASPTTDVQVTASIAGFKYFFLDGFIPGLPKNISSKSKIGC